MNRRALRATMGSGADLLARQGAQFVVLLVLARVLSPSDFGIVALLSIVVSVGVVVADAGLTTAVVQARHPGDLDLDTAFWLSAATGVLCTVAAAAVAGPLATTFGRPDLAPVATFMALTVLASALGQVQTAVLVQRLGFARLAAVGLTAAVASGAVAATLALHGEGVWALAAQMVGLPAVSSVLLTLVGPYRPGLRWSRCSAGRLLGAGRWVLAANVTNVGFLRIQTIVIGVMFGVASVGSYQRADATQQMTTDAASAVVGRVALPLFAESAGEPALLRTGLRTGIRLVTGVNAPVMALLAALSTPLLDLLYGPQWVGAAPLLSVLCLGALVWPIHVMAVNVLYGVSRNREVFVVDLVKKGIAVVALAVGSSFGLVGIAWAQVAFSMGAVLVNGRAVHRAVGLTTRAQVATAAPAIGLALVVAGGVRIVADRWDTSSLTEVVALGLMGSAAYVAVGVALRVSAVTDLLALARHRSSG